jgi:uncharacterized protein
VTTRSTAPRCTRKPTRWYEKIIVDLNKSIKEILGDSRALKGLNPSKYTDERFGLPTVQDIFKELEKPGRDPRPEFKTATFADGVEKVGDLRPGMILEGVVTNVAAFGAFVDIGVHQDGLVHVSALSNTFVKDPHSIVKAGQIVKVKVMEVDLQRQRIALTMRMGDEPSQTKRHDNAPAAARRAPRSFTAAQHRPGAGRQRDGQRLCQAETLILFRQIRLPLVSGLPAKQH